MKTIKITQDETGTLNFQSDGFTTIEMIGIFSVLTDAKSIDFLSTMNDKTNKGTLVKDLDVSLRLKRMLNSINIDYLEQLQSITETDLFTCGFGNMTVKELKATMSKHNIKLKDNDTDK